MKEFTIPYLDIIAVASLVIFGVSILFLYFYLFTFKTYTMGEFQNLQQALEDQRAKIAEEKQQVRAILQKQAETIAALEERIANGASPEQLQQLLHEVKGNTEELTNIFTPEESGEEKQLGGEQA